ncbi:histidinol-phosphatase, partial [Kaistella sp.]
TKKVLFIDRDGTIIREPEDFQIDSFEKLEFLPNSISSLSKIARELNYELVMVSNQDGLGTDSFAEDTFWPVHNFIINTLKNEGVNFAEIFIDPSFEHENKPTRKPGTAMLSKYIYGKYDLENSFVIGDRKTDIKLAENLGSKSIFIGEEENTLATFVTQDWNEIYQYLKSVPRIGKVKRETLET